MATWATVITVTNRQAKRVRVLATRTEGEAEWSQSVEVAVDPNDLAGTRDKANDAIWAAWQEKVAADASDATLLEGYEAALAADLNTREGT